MSDIEALVLRMAPSGRFVEDALSARIGLADSDGSSRRGSHKAVLLASRLCAHLLSSVKVDF